MATRAGTELDLSKVYSVGTQLNTAVSELHGRLDATRMWIILCIPPNNYGAPNSFDKRRVRAQIRSHLPPDWLKGRSCGGDWSVRSMMDEFRAYDASPHLRSLQRADEPAGAQDRNIIGIDPVLYEYIFMVDADTVRSAPRVCFVDSDACVRDARLAEPYGRVHVGRPEYCIVGMCGETSIIPDTDTARVFSRSYI